MTTRSTSDKEEVNDLYRTAIENYGKSKAKQTQSTIHTSTPVLPTRITPKSINFTYYDSEGSVKEDDDTLVPGSADSDSSDGPDGFDDPEDETVKSRKEEPPPKFKPPKGTMPNPLSLNTLKYAVEAVPFFDGQSIPLSYFIEGCEEAKSMLPADAEPQFARIIRTRIVGEARRTIQDQNFDSVTGLTEFLKKVYGPSKTLYQLQGELGCVYQKSGEDVVTYANRVKLLGKQILEAYNSGGNPPPGQNIKISLERDMCKCFIRGLKPEIEQRIARNLSVQETVTDALRIERELRSITDLRQGKNNAPGQASVITQSRETCQICHKEGHSASKCRKLTQTAQQGLDKINLGTEILICQICKKRGHSADKCRLRDPQGRQPVKLIQETNIICQLCSKPGHNAKSCRTNKTDIQNKPSVICQWCDRPGHTATNCWKKQNEQRNTENKPRIVCQNCNNFGHIARDCRSNPRVNTTPKDSVICRYCKEQGHLLENCELRIASNNRRKANSSGNADGPSTSGVQQGPSRVSHPPGAQETK
jgi:hypothetical protein